MVQVLVVAEADLWQPDSMRRQWCQWHRAIVVTLQMEQVHYLEGYETRYQHREMTPIKGVWSRPIHKGYMQRICVPLKGVFKGDTCRLLLHINQG